MVILKINKNLVMAISVMIFKSCEKVPDLNVYETEEYQTFSTNLESEHSNTWESSCIKCHNLNTDYIGYDVTNYWNKIAKKGIDTLYKHVYQGYKGELGIMPPRGSCYDCSELDIKNSIYHLFYLSEKYNIEDN